MASFVEVPYRALSEDALAGLLEEFITREGTDYGEREYTLADKRASVLAQLERGDVLILFDVETESTTLARRADIARDGS